MIRLDERQRQAVDALIQSEWPKLERYFRTKVPGDHIQELGQNTLLTYVQNLDKVTSPRGYLWGIARFEVLRHWDRYRTKGSEPFDSTKHSVLDVGPTLSSVLDRRNHLVRALQSLTENQQSAIELRHGEELSLEEAAMAMNVSLATFKRYLASAEDALRAKLGAEAEAVVAAYRGA